MLRRWARAARVSVSSAAAAATGWWQAARLSVSVPRASAATCWRRWAKFATARAFVCCGLCLHVLFLPLCAAVLAFVCCGSCLHVRFLPLCAAVLASVRCSPAPKGWSRGDPPISSWTRASKTATCGCCLTEECGSPCPVRATTTRYDHKTPMHTSSEVLEHRFDRSTVHMCAGTHGTAVGATVARFRSKAIH